MWKFLKNLFKQRNSIVCRFHHWTTKTLKFVLEPWKIFIVGFFYLDLFPTGSIQKGIMVHNQFFILCQTNIQLKHVNLFLVLFKQFYRVFWALPPSATMANTKNLISINKMIECLIFIPIFLVKYCWKPKEKGRDDDICRGNDEPKPL